jgi:HK97 family phage prohead protease
MAGTTLIPERHARIVVTLDDAKLRGDETKLQGKIAEAAADATDPGWVEGYAAVWDNIDLQNQIMLKGCFARSVKEAVPAGKCKLMVRHYRDGGDVMECIGTITEAKEDDFGLWIHAIYSRTKLAQEVRQQINDKHVKGLSVGFMPLRWDVRNEEQENGDIMQIVAHRECKLGETTVTCRPANELAEITAGKSMQSLPVAKPQISGKSGPGETPAIPPAPFDPAKAQHEIAQRRRRLSLLDLE